MATFMDGKPDHRGIDHADAMSDRCGAKIRTPLGELACDRTDHPAGKHHVCGGYWHLEWD